MAIVTMAIVTIMSSGTIITTGSIIITDGITTITIISAGIITIAETMGTIFVSEVVPPLASHGDQIIAGT